MAGGVAFAVAEGVPSVEALRHAFWQWLEALRSAISEAEGGWRNIVEGSGRREGLLKQAALYRYRRLLVSEPGVSLGKLYTI